MLYTVAIGDEFVLTAFARGGGYMRKVPMKVYGTFRFRSLDRSPLAGGFNVMDIITFRDLYGYMTKEKKKEQAAIRKDVGVKDVKPEDAEAMFEDDGDLVETKESDSFDPTKEVDLKTGGRRYTAEIHKQTYSKDELWQGVVINAAVMLKDGSKLKETMGIINKTLEKNKLRVNTMDWHTASGTIGQFIGVIRVVLYGAVFVIFVVAMIIINNSLLMSTMERTREIGTLRAIGAGRAFVRRIFLFETGVLALIFGGLGAVVGAILMLIMKSVGIPASSDFFYFVFAGPRLHPDLLPQHIVAAVAVITVVGFASTYYPARLATKISPREAMGNEE
jgi:ABC-type antimicrobial peptide transport system permease subunit